MSWAKFAKLKKEGKVVAPAWLSSNIHYVVTGGSVSYGANSDTSNSDVDVTGWVIPPIACIFPEVEGHIAGFGPQAPSFNSWQQHHVQHGQSEYDFTFLSIVKFFDLAANGNPNVIDQLFVRDELVLFSTNAGLNVRDKRHMFLSKKLWPKFRGYSVSHVKGLDERKNSSNPKRAADIEKNGFDTKFAYHCVRLLCEAEQLISGGDMDLTRDKELYKSIRRGEWSKQEIKDWCSSKNRDLERLFADSKAVPEEPRWAELKVLLLQTIESHYGSLDNYIRRPESSKQELLDDLKSMLEKHS